MAIAPGYRDCPLRNGEAVDVDRGSEVDTRSHGAEFMEAHKVVLQRNRWWLLRVEFASYGAVLHVDWFCVLTYDDIWF